MRATHWLFGGPGRDQVVLLAEDFILPADVRGEELVECDQAEADRLAAIPPDRRWEAAQGWEA
jgi:hypothetical protein